jgi:hypothetical protein
MRTRRHSQSGSALLILLVLLILGAALTASWLSLMTAQTNYVAESEVASNHRIAYNNAAAVAREYMLSQVLAGNGASGVSVTLDGGWGSVIIPASTGTPLTSTVQPTVNHFNPGNGDGYTLDVSVRINDGTGMPSTANRIYQAKSRSPILSGDLFIGDKPTLTPGAGSSVSGTIYVSDRTFLWMPNSPNTFSITTYSYTGPATAQVTLHNSNGDTVLMSNFPFVPLTSGYVNGAPSYAGNIDVVRNSSGINSLYAKVTAGTYIDVDGSVNQTSQGVSSDGAGHVTINLLDDTLTNVFIDKNVTSLTLTGQSTDTDYTTAGDEAAILILVNQSPGDLTSVQMTNRNARKLVLAVKKSSGTTLALSAPQASSGVWRSIFTLENTPTTWTIPAGQTLSLEGGIQSDRAVTVSGGGISISIESDPKLLERYTARDGWVEGYDE